MQNKPAATPSRARKLLERVGIPTDAVVPDKPVATAPVMQPPPVVETKVEVKAPAEKIVEEAHKSDEFEVEIEAPPVIAAKKDVISKDLVPSEPEDEIDQIVDPKGSYGDNFKKFRTKLKSLNEEKRNLVARTTELENKVKEYDDGLLVPQVTQQQTQRIEQLEVYERLYNFEKSPVAQQKFAIPLKREQENLKKLAEDHEVPPEALNAAFAETNSVKQDEILSKHFKTTVGAIEAKNILKNIRGIQSEYDEAKKEPVKTLQTLMEENQRIEADARTRANEAIVGTSKVGWTEALNDLRSDERFKEIQYSATDTEHNEKFVRPILTKAGQQYAQTLRMLAENGLTTLPKDLSVAIAKSYQLALYSAAVVAQRDELATRVQELETLIRTKSSLNRPGVNSTGGGGSFVMAAPHQAVGSEKAGRKVLDRVMAGKG